MYNVRTYNAIAATGLDRFNTDKYSVGADIASPDALLMRSHKLAVDELSEGLLAIARAGAGVNNVPVDACSDRGIVCLLYTSDAADDASSV